MKVDGEVRQNQESPLDLVLTCTLEKKKKKS